MNISNLILKSLFSGSIEEPRGQEDYFSDGFLKTP